MNTVLSLPKPTVRADGANLPEEVLHALTEVRVQQRLSQPTLCELTFHDPDGALARMGFVRPGSSLHVGVSDSEDAVFEGEATAVGFSYGPSQEREIRVRAYDLLHRLRKRGEIRSYVQVTASDLAKEMGADLGLSVRAETPGPLHQILIQQNRTDLDFLLDVAESSGLHITMHGRTLRLCTLQGEGSRVGLELGDTLLEARFEMNGDPACRSVSVSGWDPLSAEHYDGRATRPRVGRKTAAAVEPSRVSSPGEVAVSNEAGPDSRFAEGVAQAELDRRVAREVVFWGTAQGDPRLRPAATVSVAGVADVFSGTYVITEAIHRIDAQGGYVTEFSTLPPPKRARGGSASTTKGVITRVDDPDKRGRVKASLPTYGDVETEWMGVVCAGAGKNKGLVALPDVDDEVLVLLTNEDPALGIVLGGLYGTGQPPDSGVESGEVKRYTFQTPGEQRIQLDDKEKTVRIENSDGSYVELTPKKVRIHSSQDLEIEAPGRAVVIRGSSIDFKRA